MPVATDPSFTSSEAAAATRVADWLEIAPKPVSGSPVYQRAPLTTELGGFTPNVTVTRKDAYQEADGSKPSLVAINRSGGSLQFSIASKTAFRDMLLSKAAIGEAVAVKAHYASLGFDVWGLARVTDRGAQGGRNDIPDHGFTLEFTSFQYVDAAGNVIG